MLAEGEALPLAELLGLAEALGLAGVPVVRLELVLVAGDEPAEETAAVRS
ncbi:hypothetical protein [Streptacidiphilus carbonis]|nr:hypothetical protein [Streptacidiphilus carbonis]